MRHFDYWVIGQGIAGTSLTLSLQRLGKSVIVSDNNHLESSSLVAAGLMHPITGRRIVKSWMAEQLFPFAADFYIELEKECNKKFFHPMDSLEMITDAKTLNDWNGRMSEASVEAFISNESVKGYEKILQQHLRLIRVKQGGWVDLAKLIKHFSDLWKSNQTLINLSAKINSKESAQEFQKDHDFIAERIVFCEGSSIRFNPAWNWLPFDLAKGEILTVKIPALPNDAIVVHGIFFIPIGDSCFKVGSTYSWVQLDTNTTQEAKTELIEKISKTLDVDFEIIHQKAGIRPVGKERRPFLGVHPMHENWYIFNGLGSKGSTLAPYFSRHLAEHLVMNHPLLPEVNIERYYPKRYN